MICVPSCGHCLPCTEGRPALCEPGARANGVGTLLSGARRLHLEGRDVNHHMGVSAFAQYAVCARPSLVKIDIDLPLEAAALFGCAFFTGGGPVVTTAACLPRRSVALLGLGVIGTTALSRLGVAYGKRGHVPEA